jgi:hypothetical protein
MPSALAPFMKSRRVKVNFSILPSYLVVENRDAALSNNPSEGGFSEFAGKRRGS